MKTEDYEEWNLVKVLIQKVLDKIHSSKEAKRIYNGYIFRPASESPILSCEVFFAVAGNHAFDDRYEEFNITKLEGHKIRAYFQTHFGAGEYPEIEKKFEQLVELLKK